MINKLIRRHWILIFILFLGFVLRSFKAEAWFLCGHDHDLIAWTINDVLDGHLRLVGQETSVRGVYIGMLYYYFLIPFLLALKMDPIAGVYLSIILGTFSTISFYFVFRKMFGERVGILAAFFQAVSVSIVFTEREAVPTMPVFLWTAWFLYANYLIYKGKQRLGFALAGGLMGLIWHLNLGLLVLVPVVGLSALVSKNRLDIKAVCLGLAAFLMFNLPLIAFEMRHDFLQTRAITGSLGAAEEVSVSKLAKFDRVMQIATANTSSLLGLKNMSIPRFYSFYFLLGGFVTLVYKRLIERRFAVILSYWLLVYIVFFTMNAINVSEYYLNGMVVVWILVLAVGTGAMLGSGRYSSLAVAGLGLFFLINIYWFLRTPENKSGYVQRKALVAHIKEDAMEHDYPCVAVSYITKPGFNLGYRNFFRLEEMHVNNPDSGSPVYTIVFPHSMVDRIDRSFGALGLIYPDYERYTEDGVQVSCSGKNSNVTDSLFGYTE